MESITIHIPAKVFVEQVEPLIEKRAKELAEEIAHGRRWVGMREACHITGRKRKDVMDAVSAGTLAYNTRYERYEFMIADLLEWMNKGKQEAKKFGFQ